MILFAIRFAAELAGFAAAGYAASTLTDVSPWNAVLGVGASVALIAVWALVAAPRARNPLPPRARELVGSGLLLLVAAAMALAGQPGYAAVLAAVVVADQALLILVQPERPETIVAARARA